MEINGLMNSRKYVTNPEGSTVLTRDPKIQLYLEASALKIKGDSFYKDADGKLDSVISLAQKADKDYIVGLAHYLAHNGIKLSPVVLSTILSSRGYSFGGEDFSQIFNTPQRIGEAVALGKRYHLNNSFKKHVLRQSLSTMKPMTLRKNRMENRAVKLKDLIKLLRPKPQTPEMAELYKAIIEGSKACKLRPEDSLVSTLSSDMPDSEKLDYYKKNLEHIPINQLIRNLRFVIDKSDYATQKDLMDRIIKRLNSLDNPRFLNIFDLIEASLAVLELGKPLFEVVKRFVAEVRKDCSYGNATVLFDHSGSMGSLYEDTGGEGFRNGFKYLVLFSLLYDDLNLRFFSESLYKSAKTDKQIIVDIRLGNLKTAYSALLNYPSGGTALVDSGIRLLQECPDIKDLIVISDEVSWKEGSNMMMRMHKLTSSLAGKNLMLVNPVVYSGTCFEKNVVGMSSLNANIFSDLALFKNPKAFIKMISEFRMPRKDEVKE